MTCLAGFSLALAATVFALIDQLIKHEPQQA